MGSAQFLAVVGTLLLAAAGLHSLLSLKRMTAIIIFVFGALFLVASAFVAVRPSSAIRESQSNSPSPLPKETEATPPSTIVRSESHDSTKERTTSHPSPSATNNPEASPFAHTPTPAPSPFQKLPRLTVRQMAEMLTSWGRSLPDTEKAMEGLDVDEVLLFQGAERMRVDPKLMVVSFSAEGTAYNPFLVVFRIPFEGNEHLPLTPKEDRFRVRGVVQKANTIMIELQDGASFQSLDN